MAFTTLTKPSVGDPIRQSLFASVIDNLNDLDSRLGTSGASSGGIPNGSFETGNDGEQPPNWTAGGSEQGAIDASSQAYGGQSYQFSWSGSISAATLTSSLFPISDTALFSLGWAMWASSSTAANPVKVDVRYFSSDGITQLGSDDNLMNLTSGIPTTWTGYVEPLTPATNCRWAKIILTVDDNGGNTGTVNFDGFQLWRNIIGDGQVDRDKLKTTTTVWDASSISAGAWKWVSSAAAQWTVGLATDSTGGQHILTAYGNDASSATYSYTAYNIDASGATDVDITANYIQSSPPYDLGDGVTGAFIYALVDNNGDIQESVVSNDPPWPVPKATNSTGTRKFYKRMLAADNNDIDNEDQFAEVARLRFAMTEITQAEKRRSWTRVPHPFINRTLGGLTVVLIDPMSAWARRIFDVLETGDPQLARKITRMLRRKVRVRSQQLNRKGPPGVPIHGLRWRS